MSLEALMGYLRMNAERADDWVPVTERLPEFYAGRGRKHSRMVLVWFQGEGDLNGFEVAFLDSRQKQWVTMQCESHDVTHWRDLPEPPKGAR